MENTNPDTYAWWYRRDADGTDRHYNDRGRAHLRTLLRTAVAGWCQDAYLATHPEVFRTYTRPVSTMELAMAGHLQITDN